MAVIEGSFTAAGEASGPFRPEPALRRGRFNVSVSGDFEASLALERSFDGSTWIPVANVDLSATVIDQPLSMACEETEAGVAWRLHCTGLTSGEAFYRVSR